MPLEQWYPIYHAAIDVMGVCGEDEKAMQIVQYMRDQGMDLTAITYTAAIQRARQSQRHFASHLARLHAHLQSLHSAAEAERSSAVDAAVVPGA